MRSIFIVPVFLCWFLFFYVNANAQSVFYMSPSLYNSNTAIKAFLMDMVTELTKPCGGAKALFFSRYPSQNELSSDQVIIAIESDVPEYFLKDKSISVSPRRTLKSHYKVKKLFLGKNGYANIIWGEKLGLGWWKGAILLPTKENRENALLEEIVKECILRKGLGKEAVLPSEEAEGGTSVDYMSLKDSVADEKIPRRTSYIIEQHLSGEIPDEGFDEEISKTWQEVASIRLFDSIYQKIEPKGVNDNWYIDDVFFASKENTENKKGDVGRCIANVKKGVFDGKFEDLKEKITGGVISEFSRKERVVFIGRKATLGNFEENLKKYLSHLRSEFLVEQLKENSYYDLYLDKIKGYFMLAKSPDTDMFFLDNIALNRYKDSIKERKNVLFWLLEKSSGDISNISGGENNKLELKLKVQMVADLTNKLNNYFIKTSPRENDALTIAFIVLRRKTLFLNHGLGILNKKQGKTDDCKKYFQHALGDFKALSKAVKKFLGKNNENDEQARDHLFDVIRDPFLGYLLDDISRLHYNDPNFDREFCEQGSSANGSFAK